MNPTTPLPLSVEAIALDSVVTRLEMLERERRAADAAHIALLAEAFDLAAAQSTSGSHDSLTPRGEKAEIAYRGIRAELACTMRLSEQSVDRHLSHAFFLANYYFETWQALRDGIISRQHTTVIVDVGMVIGADDAPATVFRRAAYEAAVLAVAADETPTRLRPIAKRLAEQYSETTLDERHEAARAERSVCVIDREDGMSDLIAHLPAVEAHAIFGRLTRMARTLQQVETEARSAEARSAKARSAKARSTESAASPTNAPQLARARRGRNEVRTDLFTDLLLTGLTSCDEAVESDALPHATGLGAIQAQVHITITDATLLERLTHASSSSRGADTKHDTQLFDSVTGDAQEKCAAGRVSSAHGAALLAGHGPISTHTALGLASAAKQWHLTTAHRETGQVIRVDTYRPTAEMRRLLAARDEHCRFPGCRTPTFRCDIDHTIDAAKGGSTATNNLAHLCRNHHTLKHHGGWRVAQGDDGELDWRSPTGRHYRDRPPSTVRFTATQVAERVLSRDEPLPF